MKKTTRAIALVLCLILCAFAFASCSKNKGSKSTTADDTSAATDGTTAATAAATTLPDHVHVPEDHYTILTEPTCITEGEQAYYCEDCGELMEETRVSIPPVPTAHKIEWEVTKEATLFEDGTRLGTCIICDETFPETYSTVGEVVYTTEPKDGKFVVQRSLYEEILENGTKHFYPTENNLNGNDLFLEYSLLWNNTFDNLIGAKPNEEIISTRIGGKNDTGACNDIVWMSLKDNADNSDCDYAGGFEYGALRTSELGYPGMVPPCGTEYGDFPNIGGTDRANPEWGWHRVGIRIHQELLNEDALKADESAGATKAEYLVWAECYIDGTLIFKLSTRTVSTLLEENLLFTAQSNGEGGITYFDARDDKYALIFRCPVLATSTGTAYLVYADCYATVGNSFVQNVSKVATPSANVYTTSDNTNINAPIYYSINAN